MPSPRLAFLVPFATLVLIAHGLGMWVVVLRMRLKVGIGDGGHRVLKRAIRVHANFIEWVPLATVGLLVADLAGADARLVGGLGATLVLSRGLHAFGLGRHAGSSPGRFIGTALTQGVLLLSAAAAVFA